MTQGSLLLAFPSAYSTPLRVVIQLETIVGVGIFSRYGLVIVKGQKEESGETQFVCKLNCQV